MQEIAERLQRLEGTVTGLIATLASLRDALKIATRKEKNALRRENYREAKKRREEGRVSLPERSVLKFRDARLRPRVRGWAEVGMRFGRADKPEGFYTWLVHAWNNCCYIKKPITFSGSSFRVWSDPGLRYSWGASDLMGYVKRKGTMQLLQNPAQHDDFTKRPWWDWSYAVLMPVFQEMIELGFAELPERFRRCMRIMVGGFGRCEVYTGLYWDTNESRDNINKMLKRVGTDLQLMLRAAWVGLRVKGDTSPVQPPPEPVPPLP